MVVGVWKDAEGGGAQGQCEARIGKPQRPRQGITRAAMNFPPKGISDRTVFFFTRWRGGGNFTAGRGSQEHLIFRGISVWRVSSRAIVHTSAVGIMRGFWASDADASLQDIAELPAIQVDAVEAGWACFIWCGGVG